MPHIAPAQSRHPLIRLALWIVQRRFGRPVEPMQGYAHSGAVFGALTALEIGMERAQRVDERLRMLAELRVAALVGCRFCLDIGSALTLKLGIPEVQLRQLNDYATSPAFSAKEKAVLRYADQMTATPVVVDDAEITALRSYFDDTQLVELSAAIAHENLRARLNHALGYGAAGFSGDGFCALAAEAITPSASREQTSCP